MLINNNKFNQITFFLSGNVEVKDLRTGAIMHGGATEFNGVPYSNVEGSSYFTVNEAEENVIRILVPTTVNVDQQINNKSFVDKYLSMVRNSYNFKDIKTYNTVGSWYSEELQKVVEEKLRFEKSSKIFSTPPFSNASKDLLKKSMDLAQKSGNQSILFEHIFLSDLKPE